MIASAPRTDTTDPSVLDPAKDNEMITPLTDEKLPRESPKAFEHDPFNPPEYDSLSLAAHAPASSHAHMQQQTQQHLVASSSSPQEEAEEEEGTDEHSPRLPPPQQLHGEYPHPASTSHPASHPSRHQSSSPSSSSSRAEKRKSGGGGLRALGSGALAMVLAPVAVLGAVVAATGFAIYGSGKVVEGVGRGIAAGPEAAYRAFVRTKRGARVARAFGKGSGERERDARKSGRTDAGNARSKEEMEGRGDSQA